MLTPQMYYQIKEQFRNPSNKVLLSFDVDDSIDFPINAVANFFADPYHMELDEDGNPNFHQYKLMIPGGAKAQRKAHEMIRVIARDDMERGKFAKAYLDHYGDHFLCVECSFRTPEEHAADINPIFMNVFQIIEDNRTVVDSVIDSNYHAGSGCGVLTSIMKAAVKSVDAFKYTRDMRRVFNWKNYRDLATEELVVIGTTFAISRLLGIHMMLANIVAVYLFNRYVSKNNVDMKDVSVDVLVRHLVEVAIKFALRTGHPVAFIVKMVASSVVGGIASKAVRVSIEKDEQQ